MKMSKYKQFVFKHVQISIKKLIIYYKLILITEHVRKQKYLIILKILNV